MKSIALEATKDIDAISESKEVFDAHIDAYLAHQKNLMMMTVWITAGLGQDVDTAIKVADNALTYKTLQAAWTGVKVAVQFGKGVWAKGPVVRSEIIEKKLGQNLHQNFPTVDKFKDGVVTSINSVDLKAPTYQNTTKLSHKPRTYVDKVTGFKGGEVNDFNRIYSHKIRGRALEIAIPHCASAAQKQIMKEVVEYGVTKNVIFLVCKQL
ncbi:MAG: hypothetical protein K2X98_05755 [Alphaproteobacteria bacterium]|nr:hypothetical protein [Alphaproteobacteria bacterium]